MADDEKVNPKPDRLTISQAVSKVFHDIAQVGKLGLIGTIVTMFLSEEQGREMIKNLAGLTGHSFERVGIEGGPIARDVKGWSVQTYHQFRKTIISAVSLVVFIASLSLLMAAYVEQGWLRGLIGTAGIVVVTYVLIDLLVRWIPVLIGIGVAIGVIEAVEAKTALETLLHPFQILMGGIKEVPTSVSWMFNIAKAMMLIVIWYSVGDLYITLVPLYQTPGLIPMALPTIPLFFMIPLAEPWQKRGAQYTWILWAGVFYLIDIALLAIFREELYLPLRTGSLMARVIMVTIITMEALWAIKLAINSQRQLQQSGNPQGMSSQYSPAWGQPAAPLGRTNERIQTVINLLILATVFMGAVYIYTTYYVHR